MIVNILRGVSEDYGTFGTLTVEDLSFTCLTLELPYHGNQPNISCIPPGEYACKFKKSNRFGEVYEVKNVEGRTDILIHRGNWAGDVGKDNPTTGKPYRSDVLGCILLGESRFILSGQPAVKNSDKTVCKFIELMGKKDFTLVIE